MKRSEAMLIVAKLIAAFPRGEWPESTQQTYATSLEDFMAEEAMRAVEVLAVTSTFPPSIAEVRRLIIEERLGLPTEIEAWELALAHAEARRPGAPKQQCYTCCGIGTDRDGNRASCPDCGGTGELDELDLSAMPPVPDPIPAAVKAVGGWRAVRESNRPEFLRRDFLDAFRRLRDSTVEHANLVSLGARPGAPMVIAAAEAAALPPGES